jgi:hypothetical protein
MIGMPKANSLVVVVVVVVKIARSWMSTESTVGVR